MRFLFCLLFIFFHQSLLAQNYPEYAVANIADSLKSNANSIVRSETVLLRIDANGKAMQYAGKVVTILNKAGADRLSFADYEDNFRKIQEVNITVLDANGNKIAKYKKNQLEKTGYNDGFSLINDQKIYYLNIPASNYPVTIFFQTEIKLNGYLDFEDILVARMEEAIENLNYTIETPVDNPVLYKNFGCKIQPGITNGSEKITYNWLVKNQKAILSENTNRKELPKIAITPSKFEMDGNKGAFTSWQSYGLWYYSLCNFSNDLNEKEKETILQITGNATNDKEKIKLLYQNLQENYRYVSIQLGIGGFKPFPASFVQKNKYGDCKALSNYLQSVLSVAGINSYQALINAGKNQQPVSPDFPNHAFNHVILCVPNKGDTIWLECTSATNPFGILGAFTENRNALLITPQGGVLVATPKSKATDNRIKSKNNITIAPDFSAEAKVQFNHTGEFENSFVHYFWNLTTEEQQKYVVNDLGFKPFEQAKFDKSSVNGVSKTYMNLQYDKIQDFNAGVKYFVRPHLFTLWKKMLPVIKNRSTDFYFDYPFIKDDTTIYHLPTGFVADEMPKLESLKCNNASFFGTVIYNSNENTITILTNLALLQQRIPAIQYEETQAFFEKILAIDNLKIVIKKQATN